MKMMWKTQKENIILNKYTKKKLYTRGIYIQSSPAVSIRGHSNTSLQVSKTSCII